jgi:hypothetical protein
MIKWSASLRRVWSVLAVIWVTLVVLGFLRGIAGHLTRRLLP